MQKVGVQKVLLADAFVTLIKCRSVLQLLVNEFISWINTQLIAYYFDNWIIILVIVANFQAKISNICYF